MDSLELKAYKTQYKQLSRALIMTTWPRDVEQLKAQLQALRNKIETLENTN